ncbi:bifunctional [glutamine synthetase] adenylyltransferase/[glutamine synthetase]-adenylyl-L-tyrosine phosphorylase [Neorhizobium sp. JUb45]|uniref:bifunctional [glutamine synthetase] adenylyltransferase/[glutamine synthetase]-adenylyl-L-tyrosine phosphorylase n=1 Tax=unclassified Neorhizobium TaxID=2629175 RepID=UPI001047DF2B|nr:bifunctional [glutamine synthetase] adenylyltransferase/[glutamine synthetase]-adenylyl-L-tyrosine phosphorylase [Neorhizobium sp. JUb45]TCR04312.1 glutamate-ammonia-ligase adenylyltransferase [Neorhizobium sp. JUb45]
MNSGNRLDTVKADAIRPFNKTEARAALVALKEMAGQEPAIAALLADESPLRDFVTAAFSLSPYLRETATITPSILAAAITQPLEPLLDSIVARARNCWKPGGDGAIPSEAEVMMALRRAKREAAFVIAMADLARIFTAFDTTRWLTALADAAVAASIDHLLLNAHGAGKLTLAVPDQPSLGSGLAVIGMGKHGAGELNYSSDIDIVVFYEIDTGTLPDPLDASETYGRLMRRLVRILQERTGEGYVFRTDLRLRPDPGSTPLAVSMDAAMIYYEGRGQNWERAAYIKARPVAGDIAAGTLFLKQLQPFVFRKYLDYAAIADIHGIKRQIHAHKGYGDIAVKGHDVKLGRGGIREIEFFVQTQQLIAGGRMTALRSRRTDETLAALAEARWITPVVERQLTAAYWFLRDVEHRIQMVRDEQSHKLPTTETELKRIALMMGFDDVAGFSGRVDTVLRTVERCYARLFEKETEGGEAKVSLVFAGGQDDPKTLEWLSKVGFERPSDMSRVIRAWHAGRYRAMQSAEARERLTALMPDLLSAFAAGKRPDDVLLRFDSFLSGLPAGIQLFSLLGSNPAILTLLVTILSSAPRLADIIASRPHVFDGLLDPRLMAEMPTKAEMKGRLGNFLQNAGHHEDVLDRLRIFAAEQRFLIGVRFLTGAIAADVAARAFTELADLLIEQALAAVIRDMETAHGKYPGGRVIVLGMGKLGSYELTAGSDVDLILLYDYDDSADESDGPKRLDSMRYFSRLTQRLIAALSAPTAEGVIFEVDLRLRPSGNKGPVATRINAFGKYQREEAWTWEHLALTRARVICGDDSLRNEADAIIDEVLAQKRDVAKVTAEVAEMRALIAQEKPPKDIWDFKLIAGGLVDIEFIAQYLQLIAPARGEDIDMGGMSTAEALAALGERMMVPGDLDTALEALKLFTALSQTVRLCIDGDFDPREAPQGLVELLCRVGDCPDLKSLEGEVKRLSKAGREIFGRVVRV